MIHKQNENRMKAHYINQLHQLDYMDTDGLDIDELKQKLTIARMKRIDYNNAANDWFR